MIQPSEFRYTLITSANQLSEYVRKVDPSLLVAFDTELTSTGKSATLLGISLYDGKSLPVYISIRNEWFKGVPIEEAREILNPLFSTMRGIAHNAKFDLLVFKFRGFSEINVVGDTMIQSHLNDPEQLKKLEECAARELRYPKKDFKTIIGKNWDKINWDVDTKPTVNKKTGEVVPPRITLEVMGHYAAEDVFICYELYKHFSPILEQQNLTKIHDKIEIPLCYVIRDMEYKGVGIDFSVFAELDTRLDEGMQRLREDIYEQTGCTFNLSSPKQLSEVLYDRMGLPVLKVTPAGGRSTDSDTMSELASRGFKIAEDLSEYSVLETLSQNFVKKIPFMVDDDGRLRCSFQTEGARTGRFSCVNPNLQNQPNNPEYPVRKGYVPAPGRKFIVRDWSQIELRMLAHLSGDDNLVHAFMSGMDIHQAVADRLNVPRKFAKTINFGIIYGMGPDKLSRSLGISREEAETIINGYYVNYPGYVSWKQGVEEFAKVNGYVKNIYGRIRKLPDARGGASARAYFAALRRAVNTAIQGSCADLMKLGMIRLIRTFKERGLFADLLLSVHDEFVIEADENVPGRYYHLEEVFEVSGQVMSGITTLKVPVISDGKICNTWYDMKDDDFTSLHLRQEESLVNYMTYGIC